MDRAGDRPGGGATVRRIRGAQDTGWRANHDGEIRSADGDDRSGIGRADCNDSVALPLPCNAFAE